MYVSHVLKNMSFRVYFNFVEEGMSTFCLHIFCDTLYIYYHICDIVQV